MKTQNPLIGRSSQKFGTAIFQTWKGINVVRSKPLEVANPQTDGQRTQRNRMKEIVALYRSSAPVVSYGFKEGAVGKSEYNAFTSENIITGTEVINPDDVQIKPSDLIFSKGTLGKPSTNTATYNTGDIDLTWDTNTVFPIDGPTDQLQVVQINEVSGEVKFDTNVADRSAGSASVTAVAGTSGDQIWVYFFFYSDARRASSDQFRDSVIV